MNSVSQLKTDIAAARKFLNALDPSATHFTFVTLDDNKARKDRGLTKEISGTLDELAPALQAANAQGAGVFVTVNRTDARGRKAENITAVRAVWHEDDTGAPFVPPTPPSIEVETSPGKRHRYWLVDGMTRDEFASCMRTMVEKFGSDPNAKDLSRVMRLPGFYHCKGAPFMVRLASTTGADVFGPLPASEVVRAFPPIARGPKKETVLGSAVDRSKLLQALGHIDATPRDTWVKVGMALHDEFNGDDDGRGYWDLWSKTAGNYDEADQDKHWEHFKLERPGERVTIASVFGFAKDAGYRPAKADPTDVFAPAIGLDAPATPVPVAERPLFKTGRDWVGKEPVAPEWTIDGAVPTGLVTLLVANGGVGKTTMGVQIIACIAAGLPFLGLKVKLGSAAGLFCEDNDGRLHRLSKACARALGVPFESIADRIYPTSLLGEDAVLWTEQGGTKFLVEMERQAAEIPDLRLIVLDGASDMFAANEIARREVRAFMKAITDFAHRRQIAVVLTTHESRASANNDEHPTSGSTGWINSSRSTWRLKTEKGKKGVRSFIHVKVNDGVLQSPMTLEYDGQFFRRTDDERQQELYLLIPEAIEAGLAASPPLNYSDDAQASKTYLPTQIVKPENKNGTTNPLFNRRFAKFTTDEIKQALDSLIGFKKVEMAEYAAKSAKHKRLRVTYGIGNGEHAGASPEHELGTAPPEHPQQAPEADVYGVFDGSGAPTLPQHRQQAPEPTTTDFRSIPSFSPIGEQQAPLPAACVPRGRNAARSKNKKRVGQLDANAH